MILYEILLYATFRGHILAVFYLYCDDEKIIVLKYMYMLMANKNFVN